MKLFHKFGLAVAIGALLMVGAPMAVFAASPTTSSVQPIPTPGQLIVAGSLKALPTWVVAADPFVHVTKGVATIDASASTKLDSTTLANLQQAVSGFNALPLTARLSTAYPGAGIGIFGKPAPASLPSGGGLKVQPMVDASCYRGSYISVQWWGLYFKFSECVTTTFLEGGVGAISVIITGVAGLINISGPVGVVAAPYIFAVAGVIAAAGAVVWIDDTFFCSNHGISVSFGWVWFIGDSIGC